MAYHIGPRDLDDVTVEEWAALVEVAHEAGKVK
jgi:hypothetical protein